MMDLSLPENRRQFKLGGLTDKAANLVICKACPYYQQLSNSSKQRPGTLFKCGVIWYSVSEWESAVPGHHKFKVPENCPFCLEHIVSV